MRNTLNDLPEVMLEEHGNVTLTVDIMYINKIPSIIALSGVLSFSYKTGLKNTRNICQYDPHVTTRNIGIRFRLGNAGVKSVKWFIAMKLV